MIFRGLYAQPMKRRLFPSVAVLVWAAALQPASADVIVMQDGKRQYGLIVRNHPDEAKVTISTVSGDIAIPRTRISAIEEEPPSTSHVRLGDQYLESGNVATANENYRKAVELDKDNADAAAKLAQTQATLAAAKQEQSHVNEAQVEEALLRSAALVAEKKFEEAAQLLKSLGMGYGTRKAADVRKAYADAYVAWAVDRLDRQDPAGAA
ncbi:MAG: tetratricopeptide repeat protein, partial [Pseudomonadota bacterium]|nr:tetratricopeptide repeat protein [Pseudomonadota bacterium]